jgi:hypothetical protein
MRVTAWREIRAAEDAAVLALAHAAMCERIRELMPHVSADTARHLRWALLAGCTDDTIDLIDAAENEAKDAACNATC